MKSAICWFAQLLLLPTALVASDVDERDVLVLRGGKEVHGRVLQLHGKDGIVFLVKGKRRRFDLRQVVSLVTVNDHLETLFERLDNWPASIELTWTLAKWAHSKGLVSTAELLAHDILVQDDSFDPAHRMLGHRFRKGKWEWPIGSRFISKSHFIERTSDWGHPVDLHSEHFRVRTDAGLKRAVNTLLDLERMYLFWMRELAEPLQLWEALRPMIIEVRRDLDKFPSVTSRDVPYYIVPSLGDYASTFCVDADRTPAELFTVASQAMVQRVLVEQASSPRSYKSHLCAWAEMGLSQWVQSHFRGSPGDSVTGNAVLDPVEVALVLEERPELKIDTHLRYNTFLAVSDEVPLRWAVTECFVHFLMETSEPQLRDGFLHYFRIAHRGRGDSSSALDKALGERVEAVEERFYLWLATKL